MIFDGNFCPGDRALGQFLYKFDSKWRRVEQLNIVSSNHNISLTCCAFHSNLSAVLCIRKELHDSGCLLDNFDNLLKMVLFDFQGNEVELETDGLFPGNFFNPSDDSIKLQCIIKVLAKSFGSFSNLLTAPLNEILSRLTGCGDEPFRLLKANTQDSFPEVDMTFVEELSLSLEILGKNDVDAPEQDSNQEDELLNKTNELSDDISSASPPASRPPHRQFSYPIAPSLDHLSLPVWCVPTLFYSSIRGEFSSSSLDNRNLSFQSDASSNMENSILVLKNISKMHYSKVNFSKKRQSNEHKSFLLDFFPIKLLSSLLKSQSSCILLFSGLSHFASTPTNASNGKSAPASEHGILRSNFKTFVTSRRNHSSLTPPRPPPPPRKSLSSRSVSNETSPQPAPQVLAACSLRRYLTALGMTPNTESNVQGPRSSFLETSLFVTKKHDVVLQSQLTKPICNIPVSPSLFFPPMETPANLPASIVSLGHLPSCLSFALTPHLLNHQILLGWGGHSSVPLCLLPPSPSLGSQSPILSSGPLVYGAANALHDPLGESSPVRDSLVRFAQLHERLFDVASNYSTTHSSEGKSLNEPSSLNNTFSSLQQQAIAITDEGASHAVVSRLIDIDEEEEFLIAELGSGWRVPSVCPAAVLSLLQPYTSSISSLNNNNSDVGVSSFSTRRSPVAFHEMNRDSSAYFTGNKYASSLEEEGCSVTSLVGAIKKGFLFDSVGFVAGLAENPFMLVKGVFISGEPSNSSSQIIMSAMELIHYFNAVTCIPRHKRERNIPQNFGNASSSFTDSIVSSVRTSLPLEFTSGSSPPFSASSLSPLLRLLPPFAGVLPLSLPANFDATAAVSTLGRSLLDCWRDERTLWAGRGFVSFVRSWSELFGRVIVAREFDKRREKGASNLLPKRSISASSMILGNLPQSSIEEEPITKSKNVTTVNTNNKNISNRKSVNGSLVASRVALFSSNSSFSSPLRPPSVSPSKSLPPIVFALDTIDGSQNERAVYEDEEDLKPIMVTAIPKKQLSSQPSARNSSKEKRIDDDSEAIVFTFDSEDSGSNDDLKPSSVNSKAKNPSTTEGEESNMISKTTLISSIQNIPVSLNSLPFHSSTNVSSDNLVEEVKSPALLHSLFPSITSTTPTNLARPPQQQPPSLNDEDQNQLSSSKEPINSFSRLQHGDTVDFLKSTPQEVPFQNASEMVPNLQIRPVCSTATIVHNSMMENPRRTETKIVQEESSGASLLRHYDSPRCDDDLFLLHDLPASRNNNLAHVTGQHKSFDVAKVDDHCKPGALHQQASLVSRASGSKPLMFVESSNNDNSVSVDVSSRKGGEVSNPPVVNDTTLLRKVAIVGAQLSGLFQFAKGINKDVLLLVGGGDRDGSNFTEQTSPANGNVTQMNGRRSLHINRSLIGNSLSEWSTPNTPPVEAIESFISAMTRTVHDLENSSSDTKSAVMNWAMSLNLAMPSSSQLGFSLHKEGSVEESFYDTSRILINVQNECMSPSSPPLASAGRSFRNTLPSTRGDAPLSGFASFYYGGANPSPANIQQIENKPLSIISPNQFNNTLNSVSTSLQRVLPNTALAQSTNPTIHDERAISNWINTLNSTSSSSVSSEVSFMGTFQHHPQPAVSLKSPYLDVKVDHSVDGVSPRGSFAAFSEGIATEECNSEEESKEDKERNMINLFDAKNNQFNYSTVTKSIAGNTGGTVFENNFKSANVNTSFKDALVHLQYLADATKGDLVRGLSSFLLLFKSIVIAYKDSQREASNSREVNNAFENANDQIRILQADLFHLESQLQQANRLHVEREHRWSSELNEISRRREDAQEKLEVTLDNLAEERVVNRRIAEIVHRAVEKLQIQTSYGNEFTAAAISCVSSDSASVLEQFVNEAVAHMQSKVILVSEEKKESIMSFESETNSLKAELLNQKDLMEAQTLKINSLLADVESKNEVISSKESEIILKRKNIEDSSFKFIEMESKMASDMESLKNKFQVQIKELQDSIQTYQDSLLIAQKDLKLHELRISNCQDENIVLKENNSCLQSAADQLALELSNKSETIKNVQNDLDMSQVQSKNYMSENTLLKEEIKLLKAKLAFETSEKSNVIATLTKENVMLKEEEKKLKSSLNTETMEKHNLEIQLSFMEIKVKSLEKSIQEKNELLESKILINKESEAEKLKNLSSLIKDVDHYFFSFPHFNSYSLSSYAISSSARLLQQVILQSPPDQMPPLLFSDKEEQMNAAAPSSKISSQIESIIDSTWKLINVKLQVESEQHSLNFHSSSQHYQHAEFDTLFTGNPDFYNQQMLKNKTLFLEELLNLKVAESTILKNMAEEFLLFVKQTLGHFKLYENDVLNFFKEIKSKTFKIVSILLNELSSSLKKDCFNEDASIEEFNKSQQKFDGFHNTHSQSQYSYSIHQDQLAQRVLNLILEEATFKPSYADSSLSPSCRQMIKNKNKGECDDIAAASILDANLSTDIAILLESSLKPDWADMSNSMSLLVKKIKSLEQQTFLWRRYCTSLEKLHPPHPYTLSHFDNEFCSSPSGQTSIIYQNNVTQTNNTTTFDLNYHRRINPTELSNIESSATIIDIVIPDTKQSCSSNNMMITLTQDHQQPSPQNMNKNENSQSHNFISQDNLIPQSPSLPAMRSGMSRKISTHHLRHGDESPIFHRKQTNFFRKKSYVFDEQNSVHLMDELTLLPLSESNPYVMPYDKQDKLTFRKSSDEF